MTRRVSLPGVILMSLAAFSAVARLAARPQLVVSGLQAPGRDPAQAPPPRSIPVGKGTITGSVASSDTSRPVREARVVLNGAATIPDSGTSTPDTPGVAVVVNGARGNDMASVSRSVVTDASGRFSFANLPAGHFTLSVSHSQFLSINYGAKHSGGPGASIVLADGQHLNLSVALPRGAVIDGTVYDDGGDAAAGVRVSAWRYVLQGGVRRLQTQGAGATSDDRGNYRLFNLAPGDYLVSATPTSADIQLVDRLASGEDQIAQAIASGAVQPPRAPGYPATITLPPVAPPLQPGSMMPIPSYLPIYAPGTGIRSSAAVIHVTGSEEHAGTNITLQNLLAGTVQGTLASQVKDGVSVQLRLVSDDPTSENSPTARLDRNGKFLFNNVTPGHYTVFAETVPAPRAMTIVNGLPQVAPGGPPTLDDGDRLWGSASAEVTGSSTTTVSIDLKPGRTISGVLVFEMAQPPDLTRARFMVMTTSAIGAPVPTIGPSPQAQVQPDGRFSLAGVMPGRYTIRTSGAVAGASGPVPTMLKSSIVNGQDTLDFPIDFTAERDLTDVVVTLTDKTSELDGVLSDATGKGAADYTVLVAATDQRFWQPGSRRIVTTRTGFDGRYTVRNLPPGDYFVAVFDDLESGVQYDPELLKSLVGAATRVSIGEGAKVTQDLRVSR